MRDMRLLIRRLAAQGMTVLLSSHLMSEVEELCNRVAIVSNGALRYEGSLHELMQTTAGRYALRTTDDARAARIATQRPGIDAVIAGDHGITFHADRSAVPALSLELGAAGIGISELVPRTATLEELFFRMTEGVTLDATQPPAADSAQDGDAPAAPDATALSSAEVGV
jgi:ABC-2 type transport system ATP-binding protein